MEILFSHVFEIVWISASSKKFEKPITFECFFPYFFRIMKILFSLGVVWISAASEIFKKVINLKCLCFSMLFLYYGIHFFHVLGNAWISASYKKFKKALTLKCLCFPIFFPDYGNSLFAYFGDCMDSCFTRNI